MLNEDWRRYIIHCADPCYGNVPTLKYYHGDTFASLCNCGDVVETMLGVCRGNEFRDWRELHDKETWKKLYWKLCAATHALNYLSVMMHGGLLKRDGWRHPPHPILRNCGMRPPKTTQYTAAVAMALIPYLKLKRDLKKRT